MICAVKWYIGFRSVELEGFFLSHSGVSSRVNRTEKAKGRRGGIKQKVDKSD